MRRFAPAITVLLCALHTPSLAAQRVAGVDIHRQPDFQADLVLGSDGKQAKVARVAKKGSMFRIEMRRNGSPLVAGFVKGANGTTIAFSSKTKTYKNLGKDADLIALVFPWALLEFIPAEVDGKLRVDGKETVDGHECVRFRIDGDPGTYYAARDLRGLIVKIEALGGDDASIFPTGADLYMLMNVSFDVPDSLFQLPKGYEESDEIDMSAFPESEQTLEPDE